MPVLHKEGLVQPIRVLQLDIGHWIKMASHYRADWISRGEISHYEGDESYTDDNEDEADKPFDQELNHSIPLVRGCNVFETAWSAISIQCFIAHLSSLL